MRKGTGVEVADDLTRANGEAMKKLSKEILERDAKRDIGAELLEAIREIKAAAGGVSACTSVRLPRRASNLACHRRSLRRCSAFPRARCRIGSRVVGNRVALPRRCSKSRPHRPRLCARPCRQLEPLNLPDYESAL